jgi:hypothetical protein
MADKKLTKTEKLALVKEKYNIDYRTLEDVSQLPSWAKMGIIHFELYGMTWAMAAKEVRRSGGTLQDYGNSPAGKKYRERLREIKDDELALAKAFWRANAADLSVAAMVNLNLAIEAGDYREVGVQLRDLMDRAGIDKANAKNKGMGPMLIQINMGDKLQNEVPSGTSSHEIVVLEGEVEEDD